MEFTHIYENLEEGKFFDTIWIALPDNCGQYLRERLNPIRKYCDWITAMVEHDKSHNIPHITLRYLGYDSERLRKKMSQDRLKFAEVIRQYIPTKIVVKGISIWTDIKAGNLVTARLNWDIEDKSILNQIHSRLLEVPGYSFFKGLEGSNFDPHISLGKINLKISESLTEVDSFLKGLHFNDQKLILTSFSMNFASPDAEKNLRISLG